MMNSEEVGRISMLLGRVGRGEVEALGLVFEAAYPELLSIARARLRSSGRNACDGLDTSGLVHEVFVRLAKRGHLQAENRGAFFKYAGKAMRSVLVDCVRARLTLRREGLHVPLSPEEMPGSVRDQEFLRVHAALEELAAADPELTEIVQMRFFAGLTEAEIAEALGVTERTVRRRWERARAFMLETLGR
jgi:RNA polymerase sigma factor (TIGR02999 family)